MSTNGTLIDVPVLITNLKDA